MRETHERATRGTGRRIASIAMPIVLGLIAFVAPHTPSGRGARAETVEPSEAPRPLTVKPPLGLPPLPTKIALSEEKVALGKRLFFDRALSFNHTLACAMCHIPEQGFTSHQTARSIGMEGRSLRRNAPTIVNVAYRKRLFHDGREPDLAALSWTALLNPIEMANPSIGGLLERLDALGTYREAFRRAYPGTGMTMLTLGEAIAAYMTTELDGGTRFDRWKFGGEAQALSAEEVRGFGLFVGKAGCVQCHTIEADHALFADGAAHNTGIGYARSFAEPAVDAVVELAPGLKTTVGETTVASQLEPAESDVGVFEITLRSTDRWAYMTPSLRMIGKTAPYMHDGSLVSLEDVIEFYDRGGVPNPELDPSIRPLGLSSEEKKDLLAFLKGL